MAEISELYCENMNDVKIEEHLEESLINQDDCKKLKQEIEFYRQELHIVRLKLQASDAMKRDLQESNEILEKKCEEYMKIVEATRASTIEKYTTDREEYENQIANLEANLAENKEEIQKLQKELKKCQNRLSEESCQTVKEEITMPLENKIAELIILLDNEKKTVKALEEKLMVMEDINLSSINNYNIMVGQLSEKNKELQDAQQSIKDLTENLKELEISKVVPASDTCKGNSLFAEVEDRRQILLDKIKAFKSKIDHLKQELKIKTFEIELLKAEKSMVRKWESDAIDTLQENADLLEEYKKRIFQLENKLKIEIKKNYETEIQSTDDNFNYVQSLIMTKKKEIIELNEKIEKQTMEMLMQKDLNNNVSMQVRYWQSKAMSLETQILALKTQLEMETNKDNKDILKTIENCKVSNNVNLENIYLKLSNKFALKNKTCQENSIQVSEKPIMNEQKEIKKFVCFTSDTKEMESKPLKRQMKQCEYPIISYTEDALNKI